MTTVDSKLKHHKQEPVELIHVLYRHAGFFRMGAFSLLEDHRFLQLVTELELPAPSPPATFPQTLQSVEEPCCNSGHPEFSSHTLSASLFFSIPSGPLILPKPVSPATDGPRTPFPSLSLSALDSAAVKIYFAAARLESKVNLHSGGGKNLP